MYRRLIAAILFLSAMTMSDASGQTATGSGVWGGISKEQAGAGSVIGKKKRQLGAIMQSLMQRGLDTGNRYQLAFCGRLHSNGYGLGLVYTRRIDGRSSHILSLTFSEIKDEKERRQQRENTRYPELGRGTPYIFGKEFNLYTVQLGYGRRRLLLPALLEGNAAVGWQWSAGISAALQKPYYLHLLTVDYSTTPASASAEVERYSVTNATRFLEPSNIIGSEKWGKGINEITAIAGLFAEAAIVVIPSRAKAFQQAVKIGGNCSVYASPIGTLAGLERNSWQASLFVGLSLGKSFR